MASLMGAVRVAIQLWLWRGEGHFRFIGGERHCTLEDCLCGNLSRWRFACGVSFEFLLGTFISVEQIPARALKKKGGVSVRDLGEPLFCEFFTSWLLLDQT